MKIFVVVGNQDEFRKLDQETLDNIVPTIQKKLRYHSTNNNKIVFILNDNTISSCHRSVTLYSDILEGVGHIKDPIFVMKHESLSRIVGELPQFCDEIIIVGITNLSFVKTVLFIGEEYPTTKIKIDLESCANYDMDFHNTALAFLKTCNINIEKK